MDTKGEGGPKKWPFLEKLKGLSAKKKTQYLAVIIIIAVILTIYFSTFLDSTPQTEQPQSLAEVENTTELLEQKVKSALSKVDGAGKVEVVINFASTPELVPALAEDVQTSSSNEENKSSQTKSERTDIAAVQGGDTGALIIKENQPEVRGVIVVAEGAGDIGVRVSLLNAVTTLLDVDPGQVEVLKMDNQE